MNALKKLLLKEELSPIEQVIVSYSYHEKAARIDGRQPASRKAAEELAALRAEISKLREVLEEIAAGDGVYGQQAADYKAIARAALQETSK